MTTPERWLLALADPQGPRNRLPAAPLDARGLTDLCVLANLHNVLPAVLIQLEQRRLIIQAPALLDAMRDHLAQRSATSMYLTAETQRLTSELTSAGAQVIALKGADFAARLYPQPSLRPFIDIDLLIRADDWERADAVMSRLGYAPHETRLKYAEGYSEQSWEHPAMPGAMVEVHSDLVNSPTVRRGVSVRLEDLPLERGPDGQLRATPAGLLVIAAVHGAASHSFDKLQHLCDIAQAARGTAGPIDEDALRQCAIKTGAALSLAIGLDLAARSFNEPCCAQLLHRLQLRWPRRLVRWLMTPALVARSQGNRRRAVSWRRQVLRRLLKTRR